MTRRQKPARPQATARERGVVENNMQQKLREEDMKAGMVPLFKVSKLCKCLSKLMFKEFPFELTRKVTKHSQPLVFGPGPLSGKFSCPSLP